MKTISSSVSSPSFSITEVENIALDIRDILIESDVPLEYAKQFAEDLRQKLTNAKVAITNKKAVIAQIVKDHIIKSFGGAFEPIKIKHKSFLIGMFGPNGVGKTTSVVKLANILQKQGKAVICVSLDNFRPAAQQQLKEICIKAGVEYASLADPSMEVNVGLLKQIINSKSYDVIMLDTPGLNHNNSDNVATMHSINNAFDIDEKILVIDGTFGQTSLDIVRAFLREINFNSSIITKMDSDQVGGVFFSVKFASERPIRYIANGEKIQDIEEFNPESIANRMLGKGDIKGLMSSIQGNIKDNKEIENTVSRIMNDKMNFNDMLMQLNMIKKLGGIGKVAAMIPGIAGLVGKVDNNVVNFISKQVAIIESMTPEERANPELIRNTVSRKNRIANGANVSVADVDLLLKKLEETSHMIKEKASKIINNKK